MSSPTSLKMSHPLFIDPTIRRRHLITYIFHIWLSVLPVILIAIITFKHLLVLPLWLIILVSPLYILGLYYILIICSIIIMKIGIMFLNLRHKPREGIFARDIKNKDYKYLSLRNYARLFPSYLIASTPFPWFRTYLFYRAFGIKMDNKGIHWDCWITPEMVTLGKNVIIGHNSLILSHIIENDKLIIKRVILEDNVTIGTKVEIMPGTIIGKNTIVNGGSYTLPLQKLEANAVYSGGPARKVATLDELKIKIREEK
ncbi:MAG: acyltransferase [Promethearchaeota archaeon]